MVLLVNQLNLSMFGCLMRWLTNASCFDSCGNDGGSRYLSAHTNRFYSTCEVLTFIAYSGTFALFAGFCAFARMILNNFSLFYLITIRLHGCHFRYGVFRHCIVPSDYACLFKALLFLGAGAVIHAPP